MSISTVLTIAVPTFNMEQWLEKNLATYCDERLNGRLEVICLNNASEDSSKQIIEKYVDCWPQIFRLIDRDSRGYGSSINYAIDNACGKYFRIVDADDWVDTDELVKLVTQLETCETDVVLTDYQIVNMQNGDMTLVSAGDKYISYYEIFNGWKECIKLLPSIHSTTYKTALLKENGFYMQDNMFFVDEEYVILPYLYAQNAICYPFDVYRYQVANPAQSTSPKNRAKYLEHREKVLCRMIAEYKKAEMSGSSADALQYCFTRIRNGVGDHFTTLYMYVENRKEGRVLSREWKRYVKENAIEFWNCVKTKVEILSVLNLFRVSLNAYEKMKKILL